MKHKVKTVPDLYIKNGGRDEGRGQRERENCGLTQSRDKTGGRSADGEYTTGKPSAHKRRSSVL